MPDQFANSRSQSQKPNVLPTTPSGDQLDDVPMHMVADLVGEDHFDLVGRELIEQRVAQNHAARAAQAGEHCVRFHRVAAQVQAIHALDREAGPLSKPS